MQRKNRTAFVVLFMMVVAGSVLVLVSTGSDAATITVDDSGGQQYTTIQAAINAASTGDTVYVYSGTYYEHITISKTINLTGENQASTKIKRDGNYTGITISANFVNASNFWVDDFDSGIALSGSNCTITSNIITNNTWGGLGLSSSSDSTISYNNISNNDQQGITMGFSSRNKIIANTITNNGWGGMSVGESSNNNITANTISNNGGNGIHFYDSSLNNILVNNTVTGSTGSDLSLIGASTATTINTTFDRNKVTCGQSQPLTVQNYLNVEVKLADSTPLAGASVAISDNDALVTTGQTNAYGFLNDTIVTDRTHASNVIIEHTTTVSVSYAGLLFNSNNRNVDMSTPHTESFTAMVNNAPVPHITGPNDGQTFAQGRSTSFSGYGTDTEDGFLAGSSMCWTSNVSGYLGSGNITLSNLPIGRHNVWLNVTDNYGATANTSMNITIVAPNDSPNVYIISPAEGQNFSEGRPINFTGYGIDTEDGFLTGSSIIWTSNVNGIIGTGNITVDNLSAGSHRINLTVTDSSSQSTNTCVNVTVVRSNTVKNNNTGIYYATIQDAINASVNGDVIYAYNRTYYEHIVINKTINLIGEGQTNTIIDGGGTGTVISISVSGVAVRRFTIRNSGPAWSDSGIKTAASCDSIYIADNTITNNVVGLYFGYRAHHTTERNNIFGNTQYGLYNYYYEQGTGGNAFNNWWGGVSGPNSMYGYIFNDTENPADYGDAITSGSNYNPWAKAPIGIAVKNNNTGVYYDTIQNAINASNSGDTIYVSKGIYYEHLTINKTLTLIGQDRSTTKIDGENTGAIITLNADYVNITGFLLRNSGTTGSDAAIKITSWANHTTVSYNTMVDTIYAVAVDTGSYNTITHNDVSGSTSGMVIQWARNNTVTYNNITDSDYYGLYIGTCHYNTIMSNNISYSGWYGLAFSSGNYNTANFNTLRNNTLASVYLYSASNNDIRYNNIYGNPQSGMSVDAGYPGSANTATANWWGNATGPYNAASNPSGTGDNITDGVSFSPWATFVFDTSPNYPSVPAITTVAYTDADGAYSINWTAADYATNYILEENGAVIFNSTNSTLMYAFMGKADGTYAYRISAWNTNGTSGWSAYVNITVDNAKLPNVSSITTVSYVDWDGAYSINWTAVDYVTNYLIEENNVVIFNGTNASLSYVFASKADSTYAYRIAAWNANGTSDWSSYANITVLNPKQPGESTISTAIYTDTDGAYSINWTAANYASAYVLVENGTATIYNGTNLTYTFSGKLDATYSYTIHVWNTNDTSAASELIFVIVDVAKQPSALYITTGAYTDTDGAYSINWTYSNYVTNYVLEENGTVIFNGSNTSLSYASAGKADDTYAYRITAWNQNGTVDWSAYVNITVDNAKQPGASFISTLSYTDTDGSYNINWTAANYAINYVLEENGIEAYNGTNLSCSANNKPNGSYNYTVRAWNANGTSANCPQIEITVAIPAFIVPIPAAPSITTVPYTNAYGNYLINWTAASNAQGYVLEENGVEVYNGTARTQSFISKADGAYSYRVGAWNPSGTSNWSAPVLIAVAKLPDLYVAEITTESSSVFAHEVAILRAIIRNGGTGTASYASVVFSDENGPFYNTTLYGISSGGALNVSLNWSASSGNHTINVQITSVQPSELSVSNNGLNYTIFVLTPYGQVGALAGVVRGSSNNPLGGVTIRVGTRQISSAANGSYVLDSIPVGQYLISASKEGYKNVTLYRAIRGETQILDLVMLSASESDVTYPIVGINIANRTIVMTGAINLTGISTDSGGIAKLEISTDGTTWSLVNYTENWSVPVVLAEGANTIYIRATDTSNNTRTSTVLVIYQAETPAVAESEVNLTLSDNVPFMLNVSGENRTIIISDPMPGGVNVSFNGTATHINISEETRLDTNGNNRYDVLLSLVSINVTAGTAEMRIASIDEDFLAPEITITVPNVIIKAKDGRVHVEGTALDLSGVSRIEISTDGAVWVAVNITPGQDALGVLWDANVTLIFGNNTVYVRAVDAYGNIATESASFFIPTEQGSGRSPIPYLDAPIVFAAVGLISAAGAFFRRRKL